MKNGKKLALFLLFLLSISFSSLLWKETTNGPVTTKPLVFNGDIVVGSQDGYVYAYSASGEEKWNVLVGKYIDQPIIVNQKLMVANTAGQIKYIDNEGNVEWELDLKEQFEIEYLYGIEGETTAYVSTNKGLYKITKEGEASLLYEIEATMTPPTVEGSYIIVGAGKKLLVIGINGELRWEKEIEDFWRAKPVLSAGKIYAGTLDGNVRALDFSSGFEVWKIETNGWIVADMLVEGGSLYFGSNDGYVYCADITTGKIKWKAKTDQAVQGAPESGTIGGKEVIFVGSNDDNIYAIDKNNGDIVWKYLTGGWVNDPLTYQKMVIFGSHDNSLYAFDIRKACTITEPADYTVIGYKEVKIKGMALSEAGGVSSSIRFNGGPWEDVKVENDEWVYVLDPTNLPEGTNTVECRISDASGGDTPPYPKVELIRSLASPMGEFKVAYPLSIQVGEEFTIYVNDRTEGTPVENFKIKTDGSEFTGTGNITMKLNTAGEREMTISKTGFNDKVITINVYSPPDPVWIIGPIVVLIIIILGVYIYFAKIRKPFEKK